MSVGNLQYLYRFAVVIADHSFIVAYDSRGYNNAQLPISKLQRLPVLTKKSNWAKQVFPLTIIVIGVLLMLTQLATNFGNYLKAPLTKVEYPPTYDFATYNQLLSKFVHDGLVDYKSLSKAQELNKAVDELASISPEHFADNNQKLTFWINNYNLLILKNIINHYPLKERSSLIRDLSLRKFVIGGQTISTDDIRTGKIYPLITDPRAIFLTCGGALGFPKLLSVAITAESMPDNMDEATTEFVNRPGNVILESNTETIYISQFFKWNARLFGQSPFQFVNDHLPKNRRVDLDDFHTKTRYLGLFNWTLNEEAANK